MNFNNIEKLIDSNYKISIEASRYGNGYLVGLDAPKRFYGNIIAELIDIVASPTDVDAINAFDILEDFSEKYKGFLYARADTIYEALCKLEQNASFHCDNIDFDSEERILKELMKIKLESKL
ncbi:MAG: hypothetical protein UH241_06045 [Acutalibacteraceae bacterium]|nr:hypothetical protein [Acutalibacteraceae bacterium]MEE1154700.1 hypothetical protein [Acutalibacteraceae bacterium]